MQILASTDSVATFTQEQLDEVAAKLNGRPRQTLGWMTPSRETRRDVALTG